MKHLRSLFDGVDFANFRPNNTWVRYESDEPTEPTLTKNQLAGGLGADFAFVYIPTGETVQVTLGKLASEQVQANWFSPRTGETTPIGRIPNQGIEKFDPPGTPSAGNDWVLVLKE